MPELPDVTIYAERLTEMLGGQVLEKVRLSSPFLLRTADPPLADLEGRRFLGAGRMQKRLVFGFEGGACLVLHLMIAGRLRLHERAAALPKKTGLLALDFSGGTLLLTEQGTQRRASLHLVRSRQEAKRLDRGGIDALAATESEFILALQQDNRTLKRALTDQAILGGIGNAYSDELLFWAQLSPVRRSHSLAPDELSRLYVAMRQTLLEWTAFLRREVGTGFPDRVTAFRPEMAVHGKFQKPCQVCTTRIQRIRYAKNETNYCPRCQTGGKVLADRSLSLLLKGDFPKTIEELEGV
jgi:formamidopyrimidine-DNA glycosylase